MSTEDPADRTGRARVDRGGGYVMSIMARRPVTGGEFEATTSVNSLVKPTVGEIGEEEIGRRESKSSDGAEERSAEAHPSATRKFFKQSQKYCEQGQELLQACTSQDRNLRRPRSHFDQWDLRSFRGYCRGYDPG